MRLTASANHSSENEMMREPRAADTRSGQVRSHTSRVALGVSVVGGKLLTNSRREGLIDFLCED